MTRGGLLSLNDYTVERETVEFSQASTACTWSKRASDQCSI